MEGRSLTLPLPLVDCGISVCHGRSNFDLHPLHFLIQHQQITSFSRHTSYPRSHLRDMIKFFVFVGVVLKQMGNLSMQIKRSLPSMAAFIKPYLWMFSQVRWRHKQKYCGGCRIAEFVDVSEQWKLLSPASPSIQVHSKHTWTVVSIYLWSRCGTERW